MTSALNLVLALMAAFFDVDGCLFGVGTVDRLGVSLLPWRSGFSELESSDIGILKRTERRLEDAELTQC